MVKTDYRPMRLLLALLLVMAAGQGAAKTELAKGMLWKIAGNGQVSYLLGTVHSEDPRVLDFSETLIEALEGSEVFAMELVPDLPTLQRLTGLMHFQDEKTLRGAIGKSLYEKVALRLQSYGMQPHMVVKMKPWAAAMTLSLPPPRTGMFMDFMLSLRAAGNGSQVTALETLDEQVGFLEGMSFSDQLAVLKQAVDEVDSIQSAHDAMIDTYLTRDLNELRTLAEEQMAEVSSGLREHFQIEGLDKRNQRMVKRLVPLLNQGQVFVAVGALHLPGDQGLIALLQNAGYELTAVE